MLDFVICDDNFNILSKLEKMLETIFIRNTLSGKVVLSTSNPKEIIDYSKNNTVDVFILDIDLKNEISGLSIAKFIREHNKKAYIIFTTAHLEYSMVAYKYKTFDFLAKPITQERLEETILRLYDDIFSDNDNFFQLNKRNVFVKNDDIFFIQKEGKKAIFKTSNNEFKIYSSFDDILNKLPKNFIRCHKSYIVNLNKISCVKSNNSIIFKENIENGTCFIGPKYENFFTEVMKNGNSTISMENTNNRR